MDKREQQRKALQRNIAELKQYGAQYGSDSSIIQILERKLERLRTQQRKTP